MKKLHHTATSNPAANTPKSEPPDTSTIGGRIKALRKKKGMSQEVLAGLLATDKSVISRWENSERVPTWEMAGQIANVFGVSPDYISFGSDHRDNNDYIYVGGLSFRETAVVRMIVDILRKDC